MGSAEYGLLLAPGAGASSESPALLAVENAVPSEFVVRRMDFPYRLAGRKAPDKPAVLLESVLSAASSFAHETGLSPDHIFLGGRSMGGRICSLAVASGLPAAGLVLMSYPLHPPGKPLTLRVEHFPSLDVPCLFVSGTRDAFGTQAEVETHTEAIPADVDHVWIEGGDHGMNKYNDVVAEVVSEWLHARISE